MADDRGGAWKRLNAEPRLRVGDFLFGRNVHHGTGRIGHSWLGQQELGGPSVTSRSLLSEVRIKEARPVDRLKRPGKRARV